MQTTGSISFVIRSELDCEPNEYPLIVLIVDTDAVCRYVRSSKPIVGRAMHAMTRW